jgi:glycosyltransferase involved in cell wall biosynthesis
MTDRSSVGLRVAMALYADITYDSRVQREAEALCRAGHSVTIYCLSGAAPLGSSYEVVASKPSVSAVLPDGSSPFLRAGTSGLLGRLASRLRWMIGYVRNIRAWGRWAVATAVDVDVWHAHDLTGLMAVAPRVKPPARLVYDSHEIFLETGTAERLPGALRRALSGYERWLTRGAVALITVNDHYAKVLARRLRPRRILIVRNCPPRWTSPDPPVVGLREVTGVPESVPLVLYHGGFTRHRGIEQLADAMLQPGLESAHLALLGFGGIRDELADLVAEPRFGGRLHLLDAVPPGELLDWVAGADVDVIPLQHSTLNHWLCTPNKLWESLAAGVPVVVSDFPAMRPIVLDDPSGALGAVCDPADPTSIADAVRAIVDRTPEARDELRRRCLEAAHERWNWEHESATLIELYAELDRAGGPLSRSHVP